jgi:DNA-dependent RNA polymerase auxiliary subunit epsilon
METILCKKCGITKEVTEFYKKTEEDGTIKYHKPCKECRTKHWKEKVDYNQNRLRSKIYYKENSENIIRVKNEYYKTTPAGVYQITNKETGEVLYIGESSKPTMRWNQHKTQMDLEKVNSPISKEIVLGNINKENLHFELIEEVDDKKLRLEREKYWIGRLSPKFNMNHNKSNKN